MKIGRFTAVRLLVFSHVAKKGKGREMKKTKEEGGLWFSLVNNA